MRFLGLATLVAIIALGLSRTSNSTVLAEDVVLKNNLVATIPDSPIINAKAYGVFDIKTGEILFSHNSDEKLPIASVTKLLTAKEVLSELSGGEAVVITSEDIETEGRAGKLREGEVYKVRELLFPLLLESSNDAASSLGRLIDPVTISGRSLTDTSGLSSNNIASVKELAKEIKDIYRSHPYIFDVTTLKQYVGENTGWVNNSPVYDLPGYKGGKHGYTEEANRTLVAVFSEDGLENRELGYVILGSDDVRADVMALREVVASSVSLK